MISPAVQIATRGILNNSGTVMPCAGWLLLNIEVGVVGGGNVSPFFTPAEMIEYENQVKLSKEKNKARHFIKASILYNDEIYTKIVYTDKKMTVSAHNIVVSVKEDNTPIIKITFPDEQSDSI